MRNKMWLTAVFALVAASAIYSGRSEAQVYVAAPPSLVYVAPVGIAPAPAYVWRYNAGYGWGWWHPRWGWYHAAWVPGYRGPYGGWHPGHWRRW
ncbi:hypothetical protein GCM10007901_20420 [Dyella acidisoli]|uniref:YXWGXW repeat-containing protein n=1 Tax=Dyella acidisoli TaxID=1867834 RepID=A0ABQ5XPC7_9GAMM|nr:hypothetical protein GCM10007901_20420 [Dyella acidisoli]